jgi:hypothetical protein
MDRAVERLRVLDLLDRGPQDFHWTHAHVVPPSGGVKT